MHIKNKFFDLWLTKYDFSLEFDIKHYETYINFGYFKRIYRHNYNDGSMVYWWDNEGKYLN